ncbi:exodeoxyribonuclease III [Streptomyces alkaliphilus]|uniref:Exodeoxyribonuclease III n=1 Tax=Streptomyces alkaliphilus TaxID=1472722 RepID=A0A7W3TI03_9ACTN|nr:exodeoxyribonuclease III [Streptomyces alkaliphilus]MBB0247174.1 exodeoxyribonuclease III [Streptomyces alkaliphilus]MQS07028.1 exodeoxyribonuclease III [Streptomyces alkaliphilus]
MRIATWNVNSVTVRLERLVAWLERSGTDVLCLQELKCDLAAFPAERLREAGYEAVVAGTGRWNGVAVLSRVGLEDPVLELPGAPGYEGVVEPRAVAAVCGGVKVWSVYVPNGRDVEHPHYAYKLKWLAALRGAVVEDAAGERPFAVLGDFNVAPTDEDVWDIGVFTGTSTHVTEAERAALADLRGTGLRDVLPRPLKYDHPFTYWDYRQLAFPKNKGMRIDLVYGNAAFADAVRDAHVDREERKGKGASDHAPVVVDLESVG